MGSRRLLALVAAIGCVRVFPQHFAADDHGAHVYSVAPAPPGATGEGLGTARSLIPAEGLTLVAEWGDDRGRYDAPMHRGPSLPGDRHVVWNASSLLVVDTATGSPLRRLRWPSPQPGAHIARVAVDPAGRLVAALDARGGVILGTLDGADLAPLVAAHREAASPVVASAAAPDPPHFDHVSTEAWRGGDADGRWPSARVSQRLFFSRDGSRLVGAESIWDVATRRPLLALREGEALLAVDADATRAAVAVLGVRTSVGTPGSQCGFVPVSRALVVTALESRDLLGGTAPQPLPTPPSLDGPALGFDEPQGEAPSTVASLPVEPLAVSTDGELAVAMGDRAWWVGTREARALSWPRPVRSVRALTFTPHGIAAQSMIDAGARMIVATALYGRDGRTLRALAGAQGFAPDRAGRMVLRDGDWSLWDLHSMERVRSLPDPGALNLGAIDQARLSDEGVAVLREARGGAHVFLVGEGDGWRRVEVAAAGASLWRWALSPDGHHVALHEPHRLRVVDLRDGRVRWQREYPGEATAAVFAGDRLYVGDDRGRVSAHSPDGTEVAHVELAGRFDHATALAVSPDGATLAIGTARSRVFVFAVGAAGALARRSKMKRPDVHGADGDADPCDHRWLPGVGRQRGERRAKRRLDAQGDERCLGRLAVDEAEERTAA
ncbi:MAG: PQQ-binding-like beta-propeller repeat protein [Deltaproteobacteria bacterium]|nr:PQQ-binding-like beta-propeller repeat protein [Deltaproteobacteria bacterium]